MPSDDSPVEETTVAPEPVEAFSPPDIPAVELRWPERRPYRRRVFLPSILFLATCGSTFWVGTTNWLQIFYEPAQSSMGVFDLWRQGLIYMVAVMGILLAHEMGHFLVAVRNGIPASLPYFIPVPIFPFGTMGAVIGMQGSKADRRQLFDLGLAGPLAGLAVCIGVLWIGVLQLDPSASGGRGITFHHPLLLQIMIGGLRPELQNASSLYVGQFNPWLMAGWVGLLVTGLNMLPISQLDGGHVSYALLGRRAHTLARLLLICAILFVIIAEQYNWVLMVVLVTLLGTDHPRTADDAAPLGRLRTIVGWSSLAIPVLCFPVLGIS
jgi:membrane-associated protease RseP (regulator of RpoE activity)